MSILGENDLLFIISYDDSLYEGICGVNESTIR